MKELDDTNCEIRRIVELQSSIWNRRKTSSDDDRSPLNGSSDVFEFTKPLGNFLDGTNHAWLSYGTRLIVLNVRTGESISSWNFRYRISSVTPFPSQLGQLPLLLVGLDNDAHRIKESVGLICVFECTTSRILRVIRVPSGVEQICVISGGSDWEELNIEKTSSKLGGNSGIACVALRNLDHIIIDLQRSSWESVSSYLITDELSPYEIEFSQSNSSSSRQSSSKEKHKAYSLINSRIEKYLGFNRETFESMPLSHEKFSTTMINSKKIGCLISGCLGRVMMWQSDGTIGWISPHFDDNMSVSHLALIEPADDPRPFYYLWVACQDVSGTAAPVLRMYAMLFEKKYCEKETSFKLESDPSLKFEIELDEGDTISCLLPIERENNFEQSESCHRRGEESLLLIGTNNRMLLFDLNQWYKEQMPLTASECQNPNSILASYRTKSEVPNSEKDVIISSAHVPSSLKEFTSSGPNTLEELFFPNSLAFEWIELTSNRLTFWLTRGAQAELLRKIMITGPVILIQPAEIFHRCLSAGLVPFNVECSFNSDHNLQREMLLSLCLEQRWANFLVKCAKEWSDGSASYLFPAFLRWGVQRGSAIKIHADQLSVPLFDQSGSSIGESETKTLRFCCQQLECLSSVVDKLSVKSVDFLMQQRALKRIATYLQVLLWFHDVGLLPETQEIDESNLRIALSLRIPYPYERLTALYKEKREKLKAKRNDERDDNLFIDGLISRECPALRSQWEREGVDVESAGHYPPPSLQSLLRSYLADCHQVESSEIENKHQIIIYLLMDLAMLLQRSCPNIDQLIKYPAAFKLSPSLIKLTQAFWLLDHEDYQGFLDMMTGQLVSDSDVKDWHHKLAIKTLIHDNQHKLALMYLRVRKPPLMTIEELGTVISLSVEYGLVQSAFHCRPSSHYAQLLTRFFGACKSYGKLSEILHLALDQEEEEAFVKFLEENKSEETKLLYYLQRCRHTEASSVTFGSRFTTQLEQPVSLNMFNAYNYTLPNITRRFTSLNKRNTDVDHDFRYRRPMSHARSYNRAQEIHETVVKKSREACNRGERTQIPFVSAPCMSLRSNSRNTDVNCVLFLERKVPMKRTIQNLQGNEEISEPSGKKRRKLSDGRNLGDRNEEDQSHRNKTLGDKSELGIDALFSTPLVKRKTQFINPVNSSLETPQSILKIRQMIKQSTSTNLNDSQTLENTLEPISEKKPRQIRFSVGQFQNDSAHNESIDENDSKKVIDEEVSEMSEDTFFSPNISARSEESTILSDTSSLYGRNLAGPRPRPGLKRSANLSCNDSSSRRSSLKTESTSCAGTPSSVSLSTKEFLNSSTNSLDFNIGKTPRENKLLSASIYTPSILSDFSYEENPRKFGSGDKGLDWKIENNFEKKDSLSPGKVGWVSPSISVTSVTKSLVEEYEIHNEGNENKQVNEMEDVSEREKIKNDMKEEKELELSNKNEKIKEIETEILSSKEIEGFEEIPINKKLTEPNGEVMIQMEEKLDETDKVSRIHEDTNRNILPEGNVISTQKSQSLSENEKELEGESSDDLELLILKDEEDEEDEIFESLSNSIISDVTHSLSSIDKSTLSKQVLKEKSEFSKFVEDDFNITDDESLEVLNTNTTKETDQTLHDEKDIESNITDDESDRVSARESDSHTIDSKEYSFSDSNRITRSDSDSLDDCNNPVIILNRLDELVLHQEKDVQVPSMRNVSLRKTPVRETRARRASSIAKEAKIESSIDRSLAIDIPDPQRISSELKEDNIRKSRISREKIPVRATRALKSVSAKNDSLASQESQTSEENLRTPRRSRRASSAMNIVEQTEELNSELEVKNVERKVSGNKTPVRETKSQRSFASRNEEPQSKDVETEKVRTKRSSSLAKEILSATVELGDDMRSHKISSGSESSMDTTPKRGRPRRNAKIVQEASVHSSEIEKEEPDETSKIIRRSTRRAASVQKELTIIGEVALKKKKTAAEPIEVDSNEPVEKNTRARRGSSLTKEIPLPKKTRGSSLSKEIVEDTSKTLSRETRKRRNSVPREVSLVPSRTKRSTSISEEVIPEEAGTEQENFTTNLSSTNKVLGEVNSIPITKKRIRRPSVQSIPEEIEEILSVPTKSRSTTKNQKKETLPRTRRAASVDLPVESKRQTRRTRLKSYVEGAILEEPSEIEAIEINFEAVTKQPARRKRTVSETLAMDQEEEPEAKSTLEKPRRGRKVSQKSDDADAEFAFSPPEKTNAPKDKKGISQVPNFVFSPPHTRSKHTGQPRRFKSFIPTLTEEEKREAELLKTVEAGKKSDAKEKNEKPSKNPILKRLVPRKTFKLSKKRSTAPE